MISLKPAIHKTFVEAENVFTKDECNKMIEDFSKLELKTGEIYSSNEKVRESKIAFLNTNDNKELIEKLGSLTLGCNQQHFDFDLNFMEDIQFTTYTGEDKGFYGAHLDVGTDDKHRPTMRKLSFILQLSDPDDYEGGSFCIHTGVKEYPEMKQGSIYAFPSYMLHEVEPVTKGKRCTLVWWANGPNFK